jgi:hypothetical protein
MKLFLYTLFGGFPQSFRASTRKLVTPASLDTLCYYGAGVCLLCPGLELRSQMFRGGDLDLVLFMLIIETT